MNRYHKHPRGFMLLEILLGMAVIGGLIALLMPLLSLQSQQLSAQRDSQNLQQAYDALIRQTISGNGLPAPIRLAEGALSSGTASSHHELDATLTPTDPGWAGALPGHLLGVPTVSTLQTAYWYDVQAALRPDSARAFSPLVEESASTPFTWSFRPIVEQFDPDINPNLSTGGYRAQLCRHLNSLQALEQALRNHTDGSSLQYTRNYSNLLLPRIWNTGFDTHFTWDSALGYATIDDTNIGLNLTDLTDMTDVVFTYSAPAAFVLARRQPPAMRRLDRQNTVYQQAGITGFDQALSDRGSYAYPSPLAIQRGFRVYENPQTPASDAPDSDVKDYDGQTRAISLGQLAAALQSAGVCSAPAAQCQAHQVHVRIGNFVQSAPDSGSATGLVLSWQLLDLEDPTNEVVLRSGTVSSGSYSDAGCLDAFGTEQANAAPNRYLRISFVSPSGTVGYTSGDSWYRNAVLVDPDGDLPDADNGLNRWFNLNALKAANAGNSATLSCTGSHAVTGGELSRTGTLPSCTMVQQP